MLEHGLLESSDQHKVIGVDDQGLFISNVRGDGIGTKHRIKQEDMLKIVNKWTIKEQKRINNDNT